jgi:hypothetical protein
MFILSMASLQTDQLIDISQTELSLEYSLTYSKLALEYIVKLLSVLTCWDKSTKS